MTLEEFLRLYGPWLGMLLYFLYFQVWPTIKEPLAAWLRPERAEKRRREMEQADQARRAEERQREDRFFVVFEKMTEAITALRVMSEVQAKVGEVTAEAMQDLAENIAELRGQLNQPRRRTTAKDKVDAVAG